MRSLAVILGIVVTTALVGCGSVTTLAVVEPFSVVRPTVEGTTYLEVDPAAQQDKGALISVNQSPWSTVAVVRPGDRVRVEYTRVPDSGAIWYDVYGLTTKGYVNMVERRWYYDGYPLDTRKIRVQPYSILRQAAVR